jgi:hypothetical protein
VNATDDAEPSEQRVQVILGSGDAATVTVDQGLLPASAVLAACARAWAFAARAATDAGDPTRAERAARAGLAVLGDEYVDPDGAIVDDTQIRVLGADTVDDVSQRVAMLRHALDARLEMYRWRYEAVGLVFESDEARA